MAVEGVCCEPVSGYTFPPRALFPPLEREVQIHCMLLQRSWTRITYGGETGMRRLLEIKGRTAGLNTENFDGRNCHWFLTVKGIMEFGDAIAIGEDVIAPARSVRLCPVDLELSMDSYLRAKPIKYVHPSGEVESEKVSI